MELVSAELPAKTLVVAIDPGKATDRVLLADGERGLTGEPVSLPTLREGIERVCELIDAQAAPDTVIAIEATGSLHLPWVAELERRLPGATRLFAPSETQAARTQLGSRRFKDDDRDCAALVSLVRQGRGRPAQSGTLEALLDAVRHRRRLIAQRRVARQHLHHQLNGLCPGLSAPAGHGRVLGLQTPTGQAVLACVIDFAGRAPAPRSLIARAPGGSRAPRRSSGLSAGAVAFPLRRTPSCGPSAWGATSGAGAPCKPTSRRADGDRLGALPALRGLPGARSRAARSRHAADRGQGRPGAACLPPCSSNPSNPRALRRGALRSDSARARAVTAFRLCPARTQSSLPPARAGHSYGAKKNLPHDGA